MNQIPFKNRALIMWITLILVTYIAGYGIARVWRDRSNEQVTSGARPEIP